MAWRFVKQPNGLYARFSDIVDDFTHYSMTPEGILRSGPEKWDVGPPTLRDKIGTADDSPERFEEELETIRLIHGKARADDRRQQMSESREYYIQRHASGFVGNSLLWWTHDNNGYACDIKKARVWSEEESAELIERDAGAKYTRWPKDRIDQIIQHHVDMQDVHRIT